VYSVPAAGIKLAVPAVCITVFETFTLTVNPNKPTRNLKPHSLLQPGR